MADRVRVRYERGPEAKRAALRAAAAREVAAHGLARLNLRRIAADAGMKFDIARHHYRTNAALLIDVVRGHHAAVGERMADGVLAARGLAGRTRVEALALALLEALAAEREGHRTALACVAALPEVARAVRHGEAWLVGEFADAVGDAVLGRCLVVVLGEWAGRLEAGDAEGRRVCAAVVGGWRAAPAARTSPHPGPLPQGRERGK